MFVISLMVIGFSYIMFDNHLRVKKALVGGLRLHDITSKPMRRHKIWLKNRGCDRSRLHGDILVVDGS